MSTQNYALTNLYCPRDLLVHDDGDMWRVDGNHMGAETEQNVVTLVAIGKPFPFVGCGFGKPRYCIVPSKILDAAVKNETIVHMRPVSKSLEMEDHS